MKLVTDHPTGLVDRDFILMGVISDSDKDYGCILQVSTRNLFIEEIHWGIGKNLYTATLHLVDNDEEWRKLYTWTAANTTIFSPKKINSILKSNSMYFYKKEYKLSNDFQKRKNKGIL